MKGGYIIIDFKNINFVIDDNGHKIDGIYERLEGNYRKPTLIENLVVDGVERTSRFAVFSVDNQKYVASLAVSVEGGVLTCEITNDDIVKISQI